MLVCMESCAQEGFLGPGLPGSRAPTPSAFHWHRANKEARKLVGL